MTSEDRIKAIAALRRVRKAASDALALAKLPAHLHTGASDDKIAEALQTIGAELEPLRGIFEMA